MFCLSLFDICTLIVKQLKAHLVDDNVFLEKCGFFGNKTISHPRCRDIRGVHVVNDRLASFRCTIIDWMAILFTFTCWYYDTVTFHHWTTNVIKLVDFFI